MSDCKKFNILSQFSSTCWFNALLMCMFYSRGTRQVIIDAIEQNKNKMSWDLYKLLMKFYDFQREENIKFKPEYLLTELYKVDKNLFRMKPTFKKFGATPSFDIGADNFFTIKSVLEYIYMKPCPILLGIPLKNDAIYNLHYAYGFNNYCYNVQDHKYSQISKYRIIDFSKKPELVIILADNRPDQIEHLKKYSNGYAYKDSTMKKNAIFDSYKLECMIEGVKYVQDSIAFLNYNRSKLQIGHIIAGITCGNNRFIYNGWNVNTNDSGVKEAISHSKPCDLFNIDWMTNTSNFCINIHKCELPKIDGSTAENKKLCFNTKKGRFVYFMVRKDIYDNAYKNYTLPVSELQKIKPVIKVVKPKEQLKEEIEKKQVVKECPPGKVLNPKTNRCVKEPVVKVEKITKPKEQPKKEPKEKLEQKQIVKEKECPPGKVLNPKTNRCIKEPVVKPKKEPKEKIEQKQIVKEKECPPGKVLNPKTNRCIKEPVVKVEKITKPKEQPKKEPKEEKGKKQVVKECPPGKVLNPKTNRCNKIK